MRIFFFLFLLPVMGLCQNNGRKVYNTGYIFNFDGFTSEYAQVGWAPGCDGDNDSPAITHDGSVSGEYHMTVDGEQASWEHVVLSLIDETGLSNCTLNMEEEKSQKIEVTFSATHDAEVMIVFSDGTSKHPSAGWELAADNVPAFLMDYEASMGEVSLSNNSDTYTGNDSIEGSFGFGVFQSDSSLLSMDMINIDSTHIAELWVYYRGKGVEPSCSVLNQQVAGTLTLKEICLGRCGLPDPGDGEAPFDTYPNPSSGVVFFSEEQDAVELLSASGVVISSHQHVSSIDLSPLSKGLYILSTYYGFKKIVRK